MGHPKNGDNRPAASPRSAVDVARLPRLRPCEGRAPDVARQHRDEENPAQEYRLEPCEAKRLEEVKIEPAGCSVSSCRVRRAREAQGQTGQEEGEEGRRFDGDGRWVTEEREGGAEEEVRVQQGCDRDAVAGWRVELCGARPQVVPYALPPACRARAGGY
eukprot:scaffold6575_cov120-Isochrysis_galbana.AAC.4